MDFFNSKMLDDFLKREKWTEMRKVSNGHFSLGFRYSKELIFSWSKHFSVSYMTFLPLKKSLWIFQFKVVDYRKYEHATITAGWAFIFSRYFSLINIFCFCFWEEVESQKEFLCSTFKILHKFKFQVLQYAKGEPT